VSTRSLPLRPNLDQLKRQSHELHRAIADGVLPAAARVVAHHPAMQGVPLSEALERPFVLADAQLVIAREYGFANWAKLKQRVALAGRVDRIRPHPRFNEALAALDAGDIDRLHALVTADPSLVHARTNLQPPYGYFTAATLLHHVAGNPGRDRPLPANVVAVARVLLEAGADVHARTLGPNGGDTMGLLTTSAQASNAGVSGPLIDLLLEYGATLDLESDDCLAASLANHAPCAAEKMIELGAKSDVLAAAALGRMDDLRSFFDGDGTLLARPTRHGKELTDRDAIGLALLYAYVRKQAEAVDFLLERDGNWNMTGVNNGTALHRAAWAGDLAMVQRLVAKGADINNRDNPFHGTPMGWAHANNQQPVVEWIQKHCAVDIHDAVAFDLLDHVEARLEEDPATVHRRIDDYVRQGTPLHVAARWNGVQAATLLLDHGASRDVFDANGNTPLDIADAYGSADVGALLHERGGRRAADAPSRAKLRAQPLYSIDDADTLHVRQVVDDREWDEIAAVITDGRITGVDGNGQITDSALARLSRLDHIKCLRLGGSKKLTDAGLEHLAKLPHLQELDLSGWEMQITDEGLRTLRHLTELRRFGMGWPQRVSDAGVANLRDCQRLEHVNVMGTPTGDGTIDALAEKAALHHVKTGNSVTDAGLAMFHRFPAFTAKPAGTFNCSLMSFDAGANHLMVDGPITNQGIARLAGLEGVVGLSFFRHTSQLTADGLKGLAGLPSLLFLGVGGDLCNDEAMRNVASLSRLRMLMAQGTVASDDGFSALSLSQTVEYIWGRECPNLTGRGFAALSNMPSLRGLAVSCKRVDDDALSTLPRFPALKQLLPMDVLDDGFRYIGQCAQLDSLWCMYCRQTTDRATEHIAGLSKLRVYYAGQTKITDRSLDILSRMSSLEELTFWSIAGITEAGVARLAALPRLRKLTIESCRNVTPAAAVAFSARVRVAISV
jgi:ankyrin repeat protein